MQLNKISEISLITITDEVIYHLTKHVILKEKSIFGAVYLINILLIIYLYDMPLRGSFANFGIIFITGPIFLKFFT